MPFFDAPEDLCCAEESGFLLRPVLDIDLRLPPKEILDLCAQSMPPNRLFNFSGKPVFVTDSGEIKSLEKEDWAALLAKECRFIRDGQEVFASPVLLNTLAGSGYLFPPLRRAVSLPLFDKCGSTYTQYRFYQDEILLLPQDICRNGFYDALSRFSREGDAGIRLAVEILQEIVCETPFKTEADKTNWIGFLLSVFYARKSAAFIRYVSSAARNSAAESLIC
jgi:hypothetical protein